MPSAVEHIERRMKSLQQEIEATTQNIRTYRERRAGLRERVAELELVLSAIIEDEKSGQAEPKHLDESDGLVGGTPLPGPVAANGKQRLGLTDAVLGYLEDKTTPIRPVRVVNAVKDSVKSQSSDPRRSLFNTINNLIHSGKIVRNESGRIMLRR